MNTFTKSDIEIIDKMLKLSGYKSNKRRINTIIEKYGNINNIFSKDNELITKDEIVNKKFLLLRKLMIEYSSKKLYNKMSANKITSCTNEVVEFLKNEIAYEQNERFDILFLSNCFEVLDYQNISIGTIDRSIIFMRKILTKIVCINAKYVVLAHNHPSGSLVPSKNDIDITIKIRDSLKLFDIALVDHIIVSKNGHYSFVEGGLI